LEVEGRRGVEARSLARARTGETAVLNQTKAHSRQQTTCRQKAGGVHRHSITRSKATKAETKAIPSGRHRNQQAPKAGSRHQSMSVEGNPTARIQQKTKAKPYGNPRTAQQNPTRGKKIQRHSKLEAIQRQQRQNHVQPRQARATVRRQALSNPKRGTWRQAVRAAPQALLRQSKRQKRTARPTRVGAEAARPKRRISHRTHRQKPRQNQERRNQARRSAARSEVARRTAGGANGRQAETAETQAAAGKTNQHKTRRNANGTQSRKPAGDIRQAGRAESGNPENRYGKARHVISNGRTWQAQTSSRQQATARQQVRNQQAESKTQQVQADQSCRRQASSKRGGKAIQT